MHFKLPKARRKHPKTLSILPKIYTRSFNTELRSC